MRTIRSSDLTEGTRAPEPGWIFDVGDLRPGGPSTAEILEVLAVPGYTMFRVRWEDGSESTLLPSDTHRPHPPAVRESRNAA
jgi:hypothetical protein